MGISAGRSEMWVPWTEPGSFDLYAAVHLTLAYADVFDYPLTLLETHRYLIGVAASVPEVRAALAQSDLVGRDGDYFHLVGREGTVGVRRRRAPVAEKMCARALRYGRLLARLPFVRMVALTGALTMGNVESGDDFDYLIITEPGRLWLTRAMVIGLVVRRAALRHDEICPNYLLTLDRLIIPQRNLYTAHELAQMVPLAGRHVYDRMRAANVWMLDFLPNAAGLPGGAWRQEHEPRGALRGLAESILGADLGARVEHWEMTRKVPKLSCAVPADAEISLGPHCCKGHVGAHQQRVYEAFRRRVAYVQELQA